MTSNLAPDRQMIFTDDELIAFEADGPVALPEPSQHGFVANDGARIWHASFGEGPVVVLLHGGLGNSTNWGYLVPDLVRAGYCAVVVDSRGHGRSMRDERPFTFELMASDVLAVLDELGIERAAFVGWSDGACIALILGATHPERVSGVFFFACNMDPSGVKDDIEFRPALSRCIGRHKQDYARLSATPKKFDEFAAAIDLMQRTQPNFSARDLAQIRVPVTIAQSERDEFIKPEHAQYLARSIPNARYVELMGVSHFAPLQRPSQFNAEVLSSLEKMMQNW